jgi:twitching motility protein PilI
MARRFSLREFQQNVLNRIQTSGGAASHITTLGVQIGEQNWLVQMSDIAEVLPLPALTQVPLTKPWFVGIANIRGNLYSISDLSAVSGLGETLRNQSNRVLLLAEKYAFNAGLLVTRVLGLRDSSAWQEAGLAGQMLDERGQTWHKLDIAELLQRPDFLEIEK